MLIRPKLGWFLSAALLAPLACSDDSQATGGSGATGPGGAGAGAAGGSGGGQAGGGESFVGGGGSGAGAVTGGENAGGMPPVVLTPCGNHPMPYQCGDTIDNDRDGLIDAYDPDCLGACDNTEDSYFGGIPGQNNAPCKQDCYWDTNSGSGTDECYWDHRCDPNEVAPDYYPEPDRGQQCEYEGADYNVTSELTCAQALAGQSDTCTDFCLPLTPNGCDCFGCCELPAGSGAFVWLGSVGADGDTVCTLADVGNEERCHPCQPVPGCQNDCLPCEICIGKPEPEPGCDPSGEGGGSAEGQCPAGVQPCGLPGQAACPDQYYCVTGCCAPLAPPE